MSRSAGRATTKDTLAIGGTERADLEDDPALEPAAPAGAEVLSSDLPLPERLPFRSLAELLLCRPADDPGVPILFGTLGEQPVEVGFGQLRSLILDLGDAFATRGIQAGQTVCLLRPPRTSELALALSYATLSAMGVRVLLPMYTERPSLRKWLNATGAHTVLWSAKEVRETGTEADRLRLESLTRQLEEWGVSAFDLCDDFDLPGILARASVAGPSRDDLRLRRMLAEAARHPECLALTTSGSSGEGKLVLYTQKALLSSCASWEVAGLFREDRLGGRGLCLLFSHSMGIRAFWNSLWTGHPVCLIPPEWFLEHPERVRTLLRRMQPEHVTGGPAVYRALLELVRVFPDLKDNGLGALRCLVSSGAPFDEELAQRIEAALGLRLHNALGTTETMQVLSTILTQDEKGGGMGAPLPGVRVALEPLGRTGRPLPPPLAQSLRLRRLHSHRRGSAIRAGPLLVCDGRSGAALALRSRLRGTGARRFRQGRIRRQDPASSPRGALRGTSAIRSSTSRCFRSARSLGSAR